MTPLSETAVDMENELTRRVLEITAMKVGGGQYSFEYVGQMFVDLCLSSNTKYVIVKNYVVEQAVWLFCAQASNSFVPNVINLLQRNI